MSLTQPLLTIHDLLERWRALGNLVLPNGTELIGRLDDGAWMHAVFPGLDETALRALEERLDRRLPRSVRAFYRCIGGLSLFSDAFRVHGPARLGYRLGEQAVQPADLETLVHDIDAFGWLPSGAVPFATNSWDRSVQVVGMGKTPDEIVRCDRATGAVTERHVDVFGCVAARLQRLDELMLE